MSEGQSLSQSEREVTPALLELDNVAPFARLGSAMHEARQPMDVLCLDAIRKALL